MRSPKTLTYCLETHILCNRITQPNQNMHGFNPEHNHRKLGYSLTSFPFPGYLHQVRSYGRSISSTNHFAPTPELDFSDCGKTKLDDKVLLSEAGFLWMYTKGQLVSRWTSSSSYAYSTFSWTSHFAIEPIHLPDAGAEAVILYKIGQCNVWIWCSNEAVLWGKKQVHTEHSDEVQSKAYFFDKILVSPCEFPVTVTSQFCDGTYSLVALTILLILPKYFRIIFLHFAVICTTHTLCYRVCV